MKLLLQILWGWSVLANGAVGIQVGTLQTNNQNVKLMKMNFTSPVWLQSASNVGGGNQKEYLSFLDSEGNVEIYSLTADTDVRAVYTYHGSPTPTEMIIPKPTNQTVTIPSDPNTRVYLYGKITKFEESGGASSKTNIISIEISAAKSLKYLTLFDDKIGSIDVSKNKNLESLTLRGAGLTEIDVTKNVKLKDLSINENQLTNIDVSKNIQLTQLNITANSLQSIDVSTNTSLTLLECSQNQLTSLDISKNLNLSVVNCTNDSLIEINCRAISPVVARGVANAISGALSANGVVILRQGDEFNQTIIDAALVKGWDVQYDE